MLNKRILYVEHVLLYSIIQHLRVRISHIDQIRGPEELCHDESRLLLGGDWNHGILNDFPEKVGNVMSSQLTFTPSFSEG